MNHASNRDTQQCIERCLECYQVCLHAAMNQCLEQGGRHVEPRHFRLLMNCATLCRTAAEFMLSSSDMHGKVCAACADVCEACVQSCKLVGNMDQCVVACERCAESCLHMASAQITQAPQRGGARPASAPM